MELFLRRSMKLSIVFCIVKQPLVKSLKMKKMYSLSLNHLLSTFYIKLR